MSDPGVTVRQANIEYDCPNGVDGFLTNTAVPDVCKAAAFYESYVVGVVDAITSFPVVAATAGPYITMANTAIAALYSDCQSGALLATIQADMTNVQNAINQLNTTVGNQAKSNPALQAVIY